MMKKTFSIRTQKWIDKHYNSLSKKHIRYKLQSDFLDLLVANGGKIETNSIDEKMYHFKKEKNRQDGFIFNKELRFLRNIGLYYICDENEDGISSNYDMLISRLKNGKSTYVKITSEGLDAVRNRTYESLYISTYLSYKTKLLTKLAAGISVVSLLTAVISLLISLKISL